MTDRRRTRENPGPRRGPQSERSASAGKASADNPPASAAPVPKPEREPEREVERERQVRRARFLAELDEARELRKRVAPRRARAAELEARVLRTFRY